MLNRLEKVYTFFISKYIGTRLLLRRRPVARAGKKRSNVNCLE